MTIPSRPKVLVIGAGSSGIAALKTLRDRGLDAEAIEATGRIGGRWVNDDPELGPLAYSTLHSTTSRDSLAYADHPAPKHLPVFPSGRQVGDYCESYVDEFGLRDRISLGERVQQVERLGDDGGWRVTTSRGTREVGAVVVATGPFGRPRHPEPPIPGLGQFGGDVLHVHHYEGPHQLRGRRVVVVGVGTSAVHVACDAAEHADRTFLSMRRGAWFLPSILFGRPADQWKPPVPMSWKARRKLFAKASEAQLGALSTYGIPHPGHAYGEVHPLRSSRLLSHLAHGDVDVRPLIARLDEQGVEYIDRRFDEADLVVLATGWYIDHGFLPAELRGSDDGAGPSLLARVFHPEAPTLSFVGLVDADAVAMPIAEAQGRLIADHLCGDYAPPPPGARAAQIADEEALSQERFPAARRVRLQVDRLDYLPALERERRAGRSRAAALRRSA